MRRNAPRLVLDTDGFLRELLIEQRYRPQRHCHRPLIITEPGIRLGALLTRLKVTPEYQQDDVIDHDLILVWTPTHKRIITGADILGRPASRDRKTRAPPHRFEILNTIKSSCIRCNM